MKTNSALLLAVLTASGMACKSDSEPKVTKATPAAAAKKGSQADACAKLGLVADQATVTMPTWSNGISALFTDNCAGCHSQNGIPPVLADYASVKTNIDDSIVTLDNGTMPKTTKKLAAADIATIKAWKLAGMPEKSAGGSSTAPSETTASSPKSQAAAPADKEAADPCAPVTSKDEKTAGTKDDKSTPITDDGDADDQKDVDGGNKTATGGDQTKPNPPADGHAANHPLVSDNPLMKTKEVQQCYDQGKIYDRRPGSAGCLANSKFSTYSCDWAGIAGAFGETTPGAISKLLASYVADSWKLDQCGELGDKGTPIVFLAKENADKSVQIRVLKPKE
jgi:predicted CxxxxCH...CXXCH cytochrome family protein